MDNPVDQIKKLSLHELTIAVVLFVGSLAPGIVTIWLFSPDLIKDLSTPKLLLLGFSITFPLVIIDFVIISVFRHAKKVGEGDAEFKFFYEICTVAAITCIAYLSIDFLSLIFSFSLIWTAIGILIVNSLLVSFFL